MHATSPELTETQIAALTAKLTCFLTQEPRPDWTRDLTAEGWAASIIASNQPRNVVNLFRLPRQRRDLAA